MDKAWTLNLLCALSILCACGDDDGASRPRYRVDISDDGTAGAASPVSGPVSGLARDNREAICQSYDVYVESYIDLDAIAYLACLPRALLGGSREACEQSLDRCMALFPEPIEVRASGNAREICLDELASCEATVAQLEGCINVNLDLVFEILDDWSCALYDDAEVQSQAREMANVVEVCADLDAACNRVATNPLRPD